MNLNVLILSNTDSAECFISFELSYVKSCALLQVSTTCNLRNRFCLRITFQSVSLEFSLPLTFLKCSTYSMKQNKIEELLNYWQKPTASEKMLNASSVDKFNM